MDTPRPTPRSWDVAPLVLLGTLLGLVGQQWETVAGAVMALAGLVLLVAGLVRWNRRPRRVTPAQEAQPRLETAA